jgi:hypothetical protein
MSGFTSRRLRFGRGVNGVTSINRFFSTLRTADYQAGLGPRAYGGEWSLSESKLRHDQSLQRQCRHLAGAIHYALSRWKALTRYRDDGRVEIDNNAAERALRSVALGRKNYLFAGADSGGERAAAIHSLIGTAICAHALIAGAADL